MAHRRNLFSIAAGAPFLPTFVSALLAGEIVAGFPDQNDPFALAAATIYVPTRRAAKALASQIAAAFPGRVTLLPRIAPLGRLDDVETRLALEASWGEGEWEGPAFEAIDELDRRLALMRLVMAWARSLARGRAAEGSRETLLVGTTPAQAWFLARDLAGLIDELIIEGISWSALDHVVPDEFDSYWALTLDFLKIAAQHWPLILAERGQVETASRRAALIEREALRLRSASGEGPVLAVGSTGTNRATLRLLAAIAEAPLGALVLPGLDLELDARSWDLLGRPETEGGAPTHPQSALRRLLKELARDREEVVPLGEPGPALRARMSFLSEALRPAETTENWSGFARDRLKSGLGGVSVIEAANEREEALAVAIRMRETLERAGATAALVTPDRNLATRVRFELLRWGLDVDDSAGDVLASAPAGAQAELVLAAAASPQVSLQSLALIAHPCTSLGFDRQRVEALARMAEIALMRTYVSRTLGVEDALNEARRLASEAHANRAAQRFSAGDWRDLGELFRRLEAALGRLRALPSESTLSNWLDAHQRAIEDIAGSGPADEDAQALADLFIRLQRASAGDETSLFDAQDYAAFFANAAREIVAPRRGPGHPRLQILGLLEARLLSADVIVLAGLDEGLWPPAATTDAFLNRPMRAQLGLSSPERRIGQTAHDFVQAMGAPVVILSRAHKRGGAPTAPSRFLQRIQALAGQDEWSRCVRRGEDWLSLARALDRPLEVKPIAQPRPRPPLAIRPSRLSVTRIETLRRDPYAIYAEFILRLEPLPPIDPPLGSREAGQEAHALLANFAAAYPSGPLPSDAGANLHRMAESAFERLLGDPEWRAFQWPRVQRTLDQVALWENERRSGMKNVEVEQRGALRIALADGSLFVLSAQADRIERLSSQDWAVIDYKSGRAPSPREIECGFAPQLTLEAAMIEQGAFSCAPAPAKVVQALYVRLGGAQLLCQPVGAKRPLRALVDEHFAGLIALLSQFRDESAPYLSRPYPQFASRFGSYDHLARVKEWSAGAAGEAE